MIKQRNLLSKSKNVSDLIAYLKHLKATSHSTIFDIPMRPVREDQRHRRSLPIKDDLPVMVIIPLNFSRCTLPTHGNH